VETANKLKCLQPKLVVMEAAGGFELPVAGVFAPALLGGNLAGGQLE
jgi:hypothetical protein